MPIWSRETRSDDGDDDLFAVIITSYRCGRTSSSSSDRFSLSLSPSHTHFLGRSTGEVEWGFVWAERLRQITGKRLLLLLLWLIADSTYKISRHRQNGFKAKRAFEACRTYSLKKEKCLKREENNTTKSEEEHIKSKTTIRTTTTSDKCRRILERTFFNFQQCK